jgi:hypothetical protein
MPGLLRGIARTAVVAGTASAVAGRVQRHQGPSTTTTAPSAVTAYMTVADVATIEVHCHHWTATVVGRGATHARR